MKNVKVSLICTVKNEEESIKKLIRSMLEQTFKPDEIVIVDGGSKDKTVKFIKEFTRKYKRIRLIEAPGSNIAQGRNIAIRNTKNEIIACTDGGCILDKNWLKELVKVFKETNADIVSGVFKPLSQTFFEFCVGEVICPNVEKLKDDWNPSSRSVLFKKSVWEKVNGYPENIYTAEDTVFNQKLRETGFKFKIARNAIVYWRMRKNLKSFFKQYYLYGVGDAKARTFLKDPTKMIVILSVYLFVGLILWAIFSGNMILLTFLVSVICCYILTPGFKIFMKTGRIEGLVIGSIILLVKRLSYIIGFHRGLL